VALLFQKAVWPVGQNKKNARRGRVGGDGGADRAGLDADISKT
jgi:hypothetical protein